MNNYMNFTCDFLGFLDCDENVHFGVVLPQRSSECIRTGTMRILNLISKFYSRAKQGFQVIEVMGFLKGEIG